MDGKEKNDEKTNVKPDTDKPGDDALKNEINDLVSGASEEKNTEIDDISGIDDPAAKKEGKPDDGADKEKDKTAETDKDAGKTDQDKPGEQKPPAQLSIEERLKLMEERNAFLEKQTGNLKAALKEGRMKKKEYREKFESILKKAGVEPTKIKLMLDGKETEREIDPEIAQTMLKVVEPMFAGDDAGEDDSTDRGLVYTESEDRLIQKLGVNGRENYDKAMQLFDKVIDPQSPTYRRDVHQAFYQSDDPADFAFTYTMGANIETILKTQREKVTKQVTDELTPKIRAEVIKQLTTENGNIIPSLSEVTGHVTQGEKPSGLRKEIDELIF